MPPSHPDLASTADGLHSVAIHLLRRVRVEDRKSGLSPARLSALSVVVYAGPLRPGALAEHEQVTAPTMSALVRSLEEDGLVRRDPDPHDGRSVLVSATDAGRALLEAARARRLERLQGLLAGLDADSYAAVRSAVTALDGLLG